VIGEDNQAHYPMEPEEFASIVSDCASMGAAIVGGCCGTTPAHIAAVKANLQLPIY
jgi:methionine synthase I (cobalamin-dependent)